MAEMKTRTGFQVYLCRQGKKSSSKIASWACGTPKERPGKGRHHHMYRESCSGVCPLSTARGRGGWEKSTNHTFNLFLEFGSTCSDQDFAHPVFIPKTKLLQGKGADASSNVFINSSLICQFMQFAQRKLGAGVETCSKKCLVIQ